MLSFIFLPAVTLLLMACPLGPSATDAYVPVASDATTTASLTELQQGRDLFVNNCAACHALPLTDNYSSTQWPSILNQMAPKAALSADQTTLVKKYVTRGK